MTSARKSEYYVFALPENLERNFPVNSLYE